MDTSGCQLQGSFSVEAARPLFFDAEIIEQAPCRAVGFGKIRIDTSGAERIETRFGEVNLPIIEVPYGQIDVRLINNADGQTCVKDTMIFMPSDDDLSGSAAIVTPSCFGGQDGEITLQGIGGISDQYQYAFNADGPYFDMNTFFGLSADTLIYFIKNAEGSCTYSDTVIISEPESLTATWTLIGSTNEGSGTLTIVPFGGTPPYTFSIMEGQVQDTNTFVDITTGNYTITVLDANGCQYQEEVLLTHTKTPLVHKVQVYPNPVVDVINIQGLKTNRIEYKVYRTEGLLIEEGSLIDEYRINVQNWNPGIYTLVLWQAKEMPVIVRLLKL